MLISFVLLCIPHVLNGTGLKQYERHHRGTRPPLPAFKSRMQNSVGIQVLAKYKATCSIAVLRLHPFAATDHAIVTFPQAAACRGVSVCGTDCFELQCPILPVLLFVPTVL